MHRASEIADNERGAELEPHLVRTFLCDRDVRFTTCAAVPGRQQIASGCNDGSVLVWSHDMARPRPLRLGGHRGAVTCLASSASGEVVVSSSVDSSVKVWTNQVGKHTPVTLKMHFNPVRTCDISKDDRLVLSGSDDKLVKLSSLSDCKFVGSLVGHANWVRTAVFSPDGTLVASGSDDRSVRLWNVDRHDALRIWYDNPGSITCVCFDQQDSAVAASSRDSTINIWDVRSHMLRQHYKCAHGGSQITQVCFHPNRDLLLSSACDKTLRIWDLRAGRLRNTISGHKQAIHACCWDGNGSKFISCDNWALQLWVMPSVPRPVSRPRDATVQPASHEVALPSADPVPMLTREPADPVPLPAHELPPAGQPAFVPEVMHPPSKVVVRAASTGQLAWDVTEACTARSPLDPDSAQMQVGTSAFVTGDDGVSAVSGAALSAGGLQQSALAGVEVKPDIAEVLAGTLAQVVSQMGAIAQALAGLESRLERTEAMVSEVKHLAMNQRCQKAASQTAPSPTAGPAAASTAAVAAASGRPTAVAALAPLAAPAVAPDVAVMAAMAASPAFSATGEQQQQ